MLSKFGLFRNIFIVLSIIFLSSCKEDTIQPELYGSISGIVMDQDASSAIEGASITTIQHGNDNRVGTDWYTGDGVNIDGNNNMVTVSQVNDGHMSLNTVAGDNNNITVTQH